jgi:hypothetical protein
MKPLFTPEDLLLYIYKESTSEQSQAIEPALQGDWALMEKFKVIQAAIKRLNEFKESPRTEAVLNILKYAAEKNEVNSRIS